MKRKFFKCFLALAIITCPRYIMAQENIAPTPLCNSMIIFANGDTLKSKVIISGNKKTNEDQLTYLSNDKEIVVTSAELVSFFEGTSILYSRSVANQSGKKIIKNIVTGPLYIGQSFRKNGTPVFYIKKENDDTYIQLEQYQFDIESFLKGYINDYLEFKMKYKKKIFYDYKSLGEFASNYNSFKVPETYVPQNFENTEKIKLGVIGSFNLSNISFDNTSLKFKYAPSYSIGLSIINQYTRTFSLDFLVTYNHSVIDEKDKMAQVVINNVGIEPSFGTCFNINNYLSLKVNLGVVMYYNIESKINLQGTGPLNIKGFNVGYAGGVDAIYKSKYYVFVKYIKHNVRTNNFTPGSIETSSEKGKLSNIRFGVGFNF